MLQSKIGFYGHVKQYHNLKAEIDQAILDVLESGIYVLGPQLAKFEEELARYMIVQEAVAVAQAEGVSLDPDMADKVVQWSQEIRDIHTSMFDDWNDYFKRMSDGHGDCR